MSVRRFGATQQLSQDSPSAVTANSSTTHTHYCHMRFQAYHRVFHLHAAPENLQNTWLQSLDMYRRLLHWRAAHANNRTSRHYHRTKSLVRPIGKSHLVTTRRSQMHIHAQVSGTRGVPRADETSGVTKTDDRSTWRKDKVQDNHRAGTETRT